jgi:hypothetical protein
MREHPWWICGSIKTSVLAAHANSQNPGGITSTPHAGNALVHPFWQSRAVDSLMKHLLEIKSVQRNFLESLCQATLYPFESIGKTMDPANSPAFVRPAEHSVGAYLPIPLKLGFERRCAIDRVQATEPTLQWITIGWCCRKPAQLDCELHALAITGRRQHASHGFEVITLACHRGLHAVEQLVMLHQNILRRDLSNDNLTISIPRRFTDHFMDVASRALLPIKPAKNSPQFSHSSCVTNGRTAMPTKIMLCPNRRANVHHD